MLLTLVILLIAAFLDGGSAESLKVLGEIVAITGGIAGVLVILVSRAWPWLRGKLDRRSVQKRIGAEAFPAANIENSLKYYVVPYCQDVDPAGGEEPRALVGVKQNLFETLDNVLNQSTECRYVIILADSGMGKTSALLNYYARHIRGWRPRKFALAVVPLGFPDADKVIEKIENKKDTVLFLDALDEDTLAMVDHVTRVRDLLAVSREFGRVVITCRTQFFLKDEEIPRETGILKVGSRNAGEGAQYLFQKLYLSPFTDEQVKKYLRSRYPIWRSDRRGMAFEMIKKIPNLVVRPMLLAHIDDLIRRRRGIQYSFELYREMVEAWFAREDGFVKKESLRKFSELLAIDLYANRQTRGGEFVSLDYLAGFAKRWEIPIEEWHLGPRSLLNRDAQGYYKFAHRSIMEYLCVKRFTEGDKTLNDVEWTDQMDLFLWEMFNSDLAADGSSNRLINTAGWNAAQYVTLVRAVLNAEERGSSNDPKVLMEAEEYGKQALALAQTIDDKIKSYDALGEVCESIACRVPASPGGSAAEDQSRAAVRRGIEYFRAEMVCLEEAGSPDDIRVRNKIDALMAKSESPFEFDTVMLDASGRIIERRTCEAREIVEDLANGVVVELVKIPGGDYLMGSTAGEDRRSEDEGPRHKVTVAPFYMGKFAITQAQWRVVMGWPNVERHLDPKPSHFKGDNRPVENVSWEDAVEFCARLAEKTGRAYRLPSEAEWEYACRAGTTTPFAFGETVTPEFVNYNGDYPYGRAPKGKYRKETVTVGSLGVRKPDNLGVANGFGLYDMHGNVWEWCRDVWHASYDGAPDDGRAWEEGGDKQYRVVRGGSWLSVAVSCRSASRCWLTPGVRNLGLGFRVVAAARTP